MSKLPCKKCKKCGLYHDLSVEVCSGCGTDLLKTPALPTDIDELPAEMIGVINAEVDVFVQKCSACGALNFTFDEKRIVKICHNCHKARVKDVVPVRYEEPSEEKAETAEEEAEEAKPKIDSDLLNKTDSEDWKKIRGSIGKAVGESEAPADVDDDDDDDVDWGGIAKPKAEPKPAPAPQVSVMTLSAVTYGKCTFSVSSDMDGEYLLGRSANQRDFLANDARVGNKHCYLSYKNGAWYVRDNDSANGTAINSVDIGLGGERLLRDGDVLKLGHHSDSMAFRVSIK